MKASEIQELVIAYKAGTRAEQNKLGAIILKKYQPIIHKLIQGHSHCIDDHNEMLAIANLQLFEALHKYDCSKQVQFNTYCYYYLKAVPRIYWQNKLLKGKHKQVEDIPEVSDDITIDDDFLLDLSKILTEEELLVYKTYISKKIASSKATEGIKKKIEDYIWWKQPS